MAKERYISVDIETDGPIPGDNSMLSLGAAAFDPPNERPIDVWTLNFRPLPGARPDPDTTAFWERNQEAYRAATENPSHPKDTMLDFAHWLQMMGQDRKLVFVAYPAGFDWTFVYWYFVHFGIKSPFGFSALDMKSYAAATLGLDFRESHKRNFPSAWFGDDPHTHEALDDAIEQGVTFVRMHAQARENQRRLLADEVSRADIRRAIECAGKETAVIR